jgi:hypothetical protein
LNLTEVFVRKVVEGKDPVRGDRLKPLIIEDTQGPSAILLGRLEEQDDSTTAGRMTVQMRGKPGNDRGVPVVPAGVGDSRPTRAVVEIALLLYRDCVDLGPKHHGWTFITTLEDRSQSKATKLPHELVRLIGLDELTNDPACLDLLAGKLGASMEFAPQGHQLGQFG